MITDQVYGRSGVKIFRDYYTPADLKKVEAKGWKAETAASLRKHSRSFRANERPRVAAKDRRGTGALLARSSSLARRDAPC
jgi:hypothetical protein